MHYIIRISGLIGDSLVCTPAIHSFYQKIKKQGDTLDMWVIHENYDLYKDFKYADSVTLLDGENWHEANNLPQGIWLNTKENQRLLSLDDSIASSMCVKLKTDFLQGHRLHGYAFQTGVPAISPHFHVSIPQQEQDLYIAELSKLSNNKKVVLCAPYSRCCTSQNKSNNNQEPSKMIRFVVWKEIKEYLESKDYYVLFVSSAAEPKSDIIGGNWISGESLRKIAVWLKYANFCILLESGLGHLASAMDASILHLNAAMPPEMIRLTTNGKYIMLNKFGYNNISSFTCEEIIETIKQEFEGN